MERGIRAFVGVAVPTDASLERLLAQLAALPADLKVVTPDRLHMTLAFLGDVSAAEATAAGKALAEAARGVAPFTVGLAHVGAFPNVRRPRVVWAGVEEPRPLVALAKAVRDALREVGVGFDAKDFRAHVTLARTRSEARLAALVEFLRANADAPLPGFPVREAVLYKSTLGPHGPTYEALSRAPLQGAA